MNTKHRFESPSTRSYSLVTAAILVGAAASAQSTSRVSVSSTGGQANGDSGFASISADGRFVVFESGASNIHESPLFPGLEYVYRHDRQSGQTVHMVTKGISPSVASNGAVAFDVFDPLVPNDTNQANDVYVRDGQTGTTLASVDSGGILGNSGSFNGSISADGRFVAFLSSASNLIAGDTNGKPDIFVRDRQSGQTTRVSVDSSGAQANDYSVTTSISADGRFVVFSSHATNLVPGDTNGLDDVFVHDRQSGLTTRASCDSAGVQGNGASMIGPQSGGISVDGRFVAFWSHATNLVPGDTNGFSDVFVRDVPNGQTIRVSVGPAGAQGNSPSEKAAISADGRFVAFRSQSSNLVSGDVNFAPDVFVHALLSGETALVSVDSAGAQAIGTSDWPSISADGRFISFHSLASNLVPGDTNGKFDIFVRDRGPLSAFVSFCAGVAAACPCGNGGAAGRGCENSAGTGGALLSSTGVASVSADTVQLDSSGELPSALSIFLQGDVAVAPVAFGDGLRCAGGNLKRLYVKNAVGGTAVAPEPGDASVSARSAELGDPVALGSVRILQVYYRDPSPTFCPSPAGETFNASSALSVAWGP